MADSSFDLTNPNIFSIVLVDEDENAFCVAMVLVLLHMGFASRGIEEFEVVQYFDVFPLCSGMDEAFRYICLR